jgi:hypothetical protein
MCRLRRRLRCQLWRVLLPHMGADDAEADLADDGAVSRVMAGDTPDRLTLHAARRMRGADRCERTDTSCAITLLLS